MYKDSITDIFKIACAGFEKAQIELLKDPSKLPEFNIAIRNEALKLGIAYVKASLELCDEMLRKSHVRRAKGWYIVRKDQKTLVTCLGEVKFNKTLFHNHKTDEYCYLLDPMLGIGPNERLTDDATARLLQEAVESSYQKGGEAASELGSVSRETVKNKIHSLVFESEKDKKPLAEKKAVDYLFIDADEDHVSLQFNNKKGDLETGANGYKINTEITKLAYVYEGVEKEAPKSERNHLINAHYFSGTYKGSGNEAFWEEVYSYLDHNYDLDKVKAIYLGADGGKWIKTCTSKIAGITYALDEFHLRKYLNKMTSHMLDSAEDARAQLADLIQNGTKEEFRQKAEELLGYAQTDAQRKRIAEGRDYVLGNWMPAKVRLANRDKVHGCSAEGHVSHVLSSRMSSRPMGWSHVGADKMAHLRAYYFNNGNMLELVESQPEDEEMVKMAAGAEDVIFSASQMLQEEHRTYNPDGKYVDEIQATISSEAAKLAWFNGNIWGL